MKPGSFKVITLGCKVNQYESAFIKDSLLNAGLVKAERGQKGDVVIINTCIVTQTAAHQSRQAIRKAIRENPYGTVAAVGCYAQAFPEELKGIDGIGLIAGNTAKRQIPGLALNLAETGKNMVISKEFEPEKPFEFLRLTRFPDRTRAYLKVQDGCESFCSYCIVPFARGPYRSLDLERALGTLVDFSQEGYKEVVLTGVHLGKYGIDLKGDINLHILLQKIGKKNLPLRIRLSSIEPDEVNEELIGMAAGEPWLCRHFHIPLQSGDDRILKKMNRKHTSRQFAKLIETIHSRIPEAAIGVDIMTGFPGEDHAAHQNTLALIRELPISYLHVFPFSPRPGTRASRSDDQIYKATIKERAAELRDLGKAKRSAFYKSCLGKDFQVLVEGRCLRDVTMMKGTTDNYLPAQFEASLHSEGRFVTVRMEKAYGNMLTGSAR
jgi:threonylcarbamoyladenosine tRNA methylthiotransferase MtaB